MSLEEESAYPRVRNKLLVFLTPENIRLPNQEKSMRLKILYCLIMISIIVAFPSSISFAKNQSSSMLRQGGGNSIYLPLVTNNVQAAYSDRVNMPYFPTTIDNIDAHFNETAITWFGQVTSSENYADVRFGYSDEGLWIYMCAFDRYIWYNPNSTKDTLNQWDGASLYIDKSSSPGNQPTATSYQFLTSLSWFESRSNYQTSFIGNGSGWSSVNLNFTTVAGYRGYFNDNSKDTRGWALTYKIPYAALGLSGAPSSGSSWRIGLIMHDRDALAASPLQDKKWPLNMQPNQPGTWALLHFGLPTYTPPAKPKSGEATIRRLTSNSTDVPDAGVGGTIPNLCPGDVNFIWNQWGNTNYGKSTDFNIQNQSDVSDWPCFSKYYINFALDKIPAHKTILSATLTLHQFAQAGDPGLAQPSLIQVLTIGQDWNENTITWNNAPLPNENVSQEWVGIVTNCGSASLPWPCQARDWDISYAVAQAYNSNQPLRLVLYEADSNQNSGKYFVSSDTGDWNLEGRPKITITWADP